MVGALSSARIALGGVADDAERGLVDRDSQAFELGWIIEQVGIRGHEIDDTLNSAGRLMFVQAELEVHAHDGEVVASGGQREVEWARVVVFGRFEEAENGLRVA